MYWTLGLEQNSDNGVDDYNTSYILPVKYTVLEGTQEVLYPGTLVWRARQETL